MSKYHAVTIQAIGVGKSEAKTIQQLMQSITTSDEISRDSIRKSISLTIKSLERDYPKRLKVIGNSGRGNKQLFYWSSSKAKLDAFEPYAPKFDSVPHAMALNFIEDHFSELLPPSYIDALTADFNAAANLIAHSKEFSPERDSLDTKISFEPSGYDVSSKMVEADSDRTAIYNALNEEHVFQADYDSIHKDIGERITVSPQQIKYINHQILVMGYIHEVDKVKHFELSRLRNVTVKPIGYSFKSIDLKQYQANHKFKARVHTWVKNYFDSVRMPDPHTYKAKQESSETWVIETTITLPNHFNNLDKPDPFFFANFLGMFATSLEVLEPQCLRDEMQHRSKEFRSLYLSDSDPVKVIERSPHRMANK
ncbi:MAG: WYL domain-containing protein [Kangiellaceae bacterium]|nr:WYL domain-containing protein [Kangiellaceae bacterium]